MSNNVKLQVLLRAVDQASRPFKSIRTASKSLAGDIRETQKSLRELNGHASRIEGFRKTSAQLAVTGHALEKARQEAEALATQFKNTERPTRAQAKVLESAKRAAEDLQAKYNRLTDSVKRQQRELAAVGINTRNLAHDEQGLKNRISETTAQLNRQRDALARVSAQQAKLNAVKQRYQAGKELAGNMASVGAAGVGIAAAGTMAGVKLLMPGYEFAQKNSELQAVLGVAKDSAEMTALRKQARQLGDNTAASADDAAGAQIIIAKAGGDVDAIQAATPVTLNMALANRRTMEENAALLMGMKSAFQLSNDKVAHIGDVLSMTMNKTAADFDGMSYALTYAAPVAKNAGVSIEETAAMVGALHDAKITGSMAGTGSRAVLSRLQAPTGKAWDALKELGVKTSDSKGNTRPIFTILKEMQASFEKNRLGTAQQAEYMKTIFGDRLVHRPHMRLSHRVGQHLRGAGVVFKEEQRVIRAGTVIPNNFKNLFLYAPQGKADGIKIIPLSEVATKDDFFNIKKASAADLLDAHRIPFQLMGGKPENVGSLGDIEKVAKVFVRNELIPLQDRIREINGWLGQEVIRFKNYSLDTDNG